jgi:FkbM family methyltransferase
MLDFLNEQKSCWQKLKEENRPIFIYGMGNGAEKILKHLSFFNIKIEGIFASDEFVRGHSFLGYKVKKLSEVEELYDDFVIVLAFAASYISLIDIIYSLANKHTLYVPDVPVFGEGLFTYDYCLKHKNEISEVYSLLEDKISKDTFSNILNYKISGNIDYLAKATTEKNDVYENILKVSDDEIYMDLGAYNGDTIKEFLSYTNQKYNYIYALEPDNKNFKKLKKYTEDLNNIEIYNNPIWKKDEQILFSSQNGRQSSIHKNGNLVNAKSIDSLLKNSPISLLKMDVEGSEYEAILGGINTIKKYKPKLMISLYHRNEDIFKIPLLIKELNPNYKLFIRHQLYIPAWETNLYAL